MSVQSFDSLDDLFAALSEGEGEANDRTTVAQAMTAQGQHWVQDHPDGFRIYGVCLTTEEASPRPSEQNEEAMAEWRAELRFLESNQRRGFMFCRAYSVACPDGELGSVHVSVMQPITPEQFEAARARDWR